MIDERERAVGGEGRGVLEDSGVRGYEYAVSGGIGDSQSGRRWSRGKGLGERMSYEEKV